MNSGINLVRANIELRDVLKKLSGPPEKINLKISYSITKFVDILYQTILTPWSFSGGVDKASGATVNEGFEKYSAYYEEVFTFFQVEPILNLRLRPVLLMMATSSF